MSQKTRERAVRIVVGSLLASDLTKLEIHDVAEDFSYGGLGSEIAEMLREASRIIRDSHFKSYSEPPRSTTADIAYGLVQNRKLSKKSLLDILASIAPKLGKAAPSDLTIRQIVQRFTDAATPSQVAKLINTLSEASQDPYLKGIVRRG